jgi:hypothetical protein
MKTGASIELTLLLTPLHRSPTSKRNPDGAE